MRRGTRLSLEALQPYLLSGEWGVGSGAKRTESGNRPADSETRQENFLSPPHSPFPTLHSPLTWAEIYGNEHPVEIEVGFGKGLFLLTSGQGRPDTNFLGLEIERKYTLFTANRVAKRGLTNVRLATADARILFRDRVPPASVQTVHIFFPDPWWKNKHRKRRLFTEEFAQQCARILRPAGRLHLVTDVADYFANIQDMLSRQNLWRPLPPAEPGTPHSDMDYLTNFERKYRLEGRPIWRALFEKKG